MHQLHIRWIVVASVLLTLAAGPASAQGNDGIPVTDQATFDNCSECHVVDDEGRMSRISFMRKTPEGWQTSIRRMVMLNGVDLDPAVARQIVRYLSNRHGLAPAEVEPGRFEVERRLIDHRYEADEETETTCKQCHSLGRVITQRRTKDEWDLLMATHRGLYPLVDFQAFRRGGPPPEDGDARHPMDKAVAHLSKVFPLETAEWSAWSATMRPPRIAGSWILRGHDPGNGPVYGRVDVRATGDDEYATTVRMTYARSGRTVQRAGQGIVYTGFQWRGRSSETGDRNAWREVLMLERGWDRMTGRWFGGDYDEFGPDVALRRISGPIVAGVYPTAVRSDGSAQDVRVYGANLPADLSAADVDFGPGLTVMRISALDENGVTVRIRADDEAAVGWRDLFVAGLHVEKAVAVYDEISRLRVTPQAGMARVGGGAFPKGYTQFEAVALHDGVDGDPDTDDDLNLGQVDVTWSVEEYDRTFEDDDRSFVGSLDANGLFTPALDGPNPERTGDRNNVGDVWVVATYAGPAAGRPLRARAHLLVTVPLYLRWEPWRASR